MSTEILLTSAEIWCVKEALTNETYRDGDRVRYFIRKCEKNRVSRERCRALLDAFFDVPFCACTPLCNGITSEWIAEDHRGVFDLTNYEEERCL